jgi:hypothetical protein
VSYAGFGSFEGGPETVDEVAGFTDMMGAASVANHSKKGMPWNTDATKSLIWLWFFMLFSYWLTGYFFRRHLA